MTERTGIPRIDSWLSTGLEAGRPMLAPELVLRQAFTRIYMRADLAHLMREADRRAALAFPWPAQRCAPSLQPISWPAAAHAAPYMPGQAV